MPDTGDGPARLVSDNQGLVAENLGKEFRKRPVLRGVSLSVKRGEAIGLLGPNGAGKTTCFYLITGLIAPDYGTITLDGHDVTDLPMYRRARMGVGYLPQEPSIFRKMTVRDNVMAILETLDLSADERQERLTHLLNGLGLNELADQKAMTLSGGERRRLEITRALVTNPSFLMLDEPFSGVDPIAVKDVKKIIGQLRDMGLGILITDHNAPETIAIVDRAYIIYEGKIISEGDPDHVLNDLKAKEVYWGD